MKSVTLLPRQIQHIQAAMDDMLRCTTREGMPRARTRFSEGIMSTHPGLVYIATWPEGPSTCRNVRLLSRVVPVTAADLRRLGAGDLLQEVESHTGCDGCCLPRLVSA
jgi:hypothetical protein